MVFLRTSCANLPWNQDEQGNPRHTFLMVDTRDSTLSQETPPIYGTHQLMFDTIAFDRETTGVLTEEDPRQIACGNGTTVNFSGDDTNGFVDAEIPSIWIPHIARQTGPYGTDIWVINGAIEAKPLTFVGYDSSAQVIGHQIKTIEPSMQWVADAHGLFPGRGVSHIKLRHGPNIWAGATCIARHGDGHSGSVPEKSAAWLNFVVYPDDREETFDGMALVNGGVDAAQWQVTGVGAEGQTLFTSPMTDLLPEHKHVFLVDDAPTKSVAYFRITSSQPLAVMALRGTRPGRVPGYLTELELDAALTPDLNCANNQLTHLGDLSLLTVLESLDCSGNLLTELPDFLNHRRLSQLDCSSNLLTSLPMWSASDYYRGIALDCSHNQISAFPPDLPIIRIRSLDCSHNQLTTMPDFSLSWIHALDCSHNQLTELPMLPFRTYSPPPCLFAPGNFFDSEDCGYIEAYQLQGPLQFVVNPQADGSYLYCSMP